MNNVLNIFKNKEVMPWSSKNYPVSMKNLPKEVREKAIEIANALLRENDLEERFVIAIAINHAKNWAVNHEIKINKRRKKSHTVDVKEPDDHYVIPYNKAVWVIKEEGQNRVEKIRSTVKRARSKLKKLI